MIRQRLFLQSSRTTSRLHRRKCSLAYANHSNNNNNSSCRSRPSLAISAVNSRSLHFQPHPVPAVAVVDDYYEEEEQNNHVVSFDITMTSSNDSNNNNTPRFMGNNYRISGGGGGGGNTPGGGGGKHRCPKCGAFVTFQEHNTNRIQNCFYCAACSGWFLVQPDHEVRVGEHNRMLLEQQRLERGNSGGKLEGVQVKSRGENHQFVMQDVRKFVFCHNDVVRVLHTFQIIIGI
eukprot:scaffold49272_cov56-Cyclotella_meneghiniana.AAC.2